MRTLAFFALLLAGCTASQAQTKLITSWKRNTTGKVATYYYNNGGQPPTYTWTVSTDSADVLTVAYTTDSVWIRCNGLTDSMGKYFNPGGCLAQNYVYRFPRTSNVPATKTISPKVGAIGVLLNGVPIYGLSNSSSYNGSTNSNANGAGVWNVEVGLSEGFVLDANYGAHPQQGGAYHTHDKPYRMYRDSGTTKHSPLIGFAFDGHPVYGPYGYASALSATSGISRMKTGYSLRNISTRTTLPTLPNGGGTASQAGPPVSTTYPLGTYCEDYEWLTANGGDLDQYNGRFCVTPEFPGGTYAYFVTIDASGNAAFPYYIGIYYHGQPVTANISTQSGGATTGLTIPSAATRYTGGVPLPVFTTGFSGKATGAHNRLEWAWGAGDNMPLVAIERSEEGRLFDRIGLQPARTEPGGEQVFVDGAPPLHSYYRLQLTGTDGGVMYSPTILIQRSAEADWQLYPTLTSAAITVEAPCGTPYTITDATGRTALEGVTAAGSRTTVLDLSALAAGAYYFQKNGSAPSSVRKFFKY